MISRRSFTKQGMALAYTGWSALRPSVAQSAEPTAAKNSTVSRYVNPMIGTGGHGHCYPGATVPFGMVQLSPDTYDQGWDWCSGYNYSDSSIMGFSHTHLSGTGIGDMMDFLVMACTGPVKTEPGTRENPELGYRSRFSHRDETAVPGYYSVLLRDYAIRAELTATTRAGFHRYTFPRHKQSYFIVDLSHGYAGGPQAVRWSQLEIEGTDTLKGGKSTNRWAKGRENYFAMKFSRPFDRISVLVDGKLLEHPTGVIRGNSIKAILHYTTHKDEQILVKTGISGVSIEGASANLQAEIPAWDFDSVRHTAADAWEQSLSRIRIEGGTPKQREIFYTSLYHTMMAPTLFDDADGSYRGMDGVNHKLQPGQHSFSSYSLWDTYRAVHPLYTVALPERVPALVNSLIRMAGESPEGMPVWPLQGKETLCMTGYHSATVIAEAIGKGFEGIDARAAYTAIKKQAEQSELKGIGLYRQYGYIPCDKDEESVSRTLDYAYNDFALAKVAKHVGEEEVSRTYLKKSLAYRNLFDSGTAFMRPKLADGNWATPFAENEMGHQPGLRDYTESNPWQSTFAVQHDPAGLAELLGGRPQLAQKLDGIFSASSQLPPDAPPDIAGLVGQYAHGNEPSHHIAYLYIYAGQAHKAQSRLRSLMETMYNNQPDGLAGNEDCGQMSAWYVLSAMGFYAVDPISGNYVFGTPLFDSVTVDLGKGKQLTIDVTRSASSACYIQSIELNGKPYDRLWFAHQDIASGAHFHLKLDTTPNPSFGSDPSQLPPSLVL